MKIYIVLAGKGGILDQRQVTILPNDAMDGYGESINTCLYDTLADPSTAWSLRVGDSITIVQED